jgi:hypothetical protein
MGETQAISSTSQKSFWKRDKIKLLSVLAFVVSAELLLGGYITAIQVGSPVLLFPLFMLFLTLNNVLLLPALILTPLIFLTVGYLMFKNLTKYGLQFLLMIAACVFLLLAFFVIGGGDWLVPIDRIELSDKTYRLTERHIFDEFTPYGTFVIYECSTFGMVCSIVDKTKNTYEADKTQTQLLAVPETNSISIVVNGEMIYTYTPE